MWVRYGGWVEGVQTRYTLWHKLDFMWQKLDFLNWVILESHGNWPALACHLWKRTYIVTVKISLHGECFNGDVVVAICHLSCRTLAHTRLVPSPSPQLLSLAVWIIRRRPGENYHVMYATDIKLFPLRHKVNAQSRLRRTGAHVGRLSNKFCV